MAREEDDFRGRRKKVAITSADAEAWIRAKREEREEFEKNEGKPLYVHDEQMNRLQREHAEIGAREERQQREITERRQQEERRREDSKRDEQSAQQNAAQETANQQKHQQQSEQQEKAQQARAAMEEMGRSM